MRTITALYDSYDDAKLTINDLEAVHIPHDAISILANHVDGRDYVDARVKEGSAAGAGGTAGALVGGGAGLLAGLGMIAIPGIGPVVAAGWLAATAAGAVAGAGVGAIAGGLLGALAGEGVGAREAHLYAEGVRRGGCLVTARVAEDQIAVAEEILRKRGVDLAVRENEYRAGGWKSFDDAAPPYTAAEIERERLRNLPNLPP